MIKKKKLSNGNGFQNGDKGKKKKIFIFQVITLIILVAAMIVGAYFSGSEFNYKYKLGIAYSGGYNVMVDVYNTKDNSDPDTPNGDNKQGIDLLRSKLDPLNVSNLYLQAVGKHSLDLTIGNGNFPTITDLKNTIQRLGAIYLTNQNGQDLLVNGNERVPLSDVISGAKFVLDQQRRPMVQLLIKDNAKWQAAIKKLTPEGQQAKASPLFIWTDIGQYIDELRQDYKNFGTTLVSFYNDIYSNLPIDIQSRMNDLFTVRYFDTSIRQYRDVNLLDLRTDIPRATSIFTDSESDPTFDRVKSQALEIDPNDTKAASNQYIDPLRPYLTKIFSWSSKIREKYTKYLVNINSLATQNQANPAEFLTPTETDAKQISSLVNGGLSGLRFKVSGYSIIPPVLSATAVKIAWIALSIVAVLLAVYLLAYYRIFGLVVIVTLIFTIMVSLYFSSLLGVQIGPDSIVAILVAIGLGLETSLMLFARYKHERYNNKLPYEPAIKIANKQTIAMFIDALVVLLIFGLSLFWVGTNNIKSFATMFLITLIASFAVIFVIGRIMYWIIIKLRWQERFAWLDIQKNTPWEILISKRKAKKASALAATNSAAVAVQPIGENAIDSDTTVTVSEESSQILSDKFFRKASGESLDKDKKIKSWFKRNMNFYGITKISTLLGTLLIVIGGILVLTGKANIDSSIRAGTNLTLNDAENFTDIIGKDEDQQKKWFENRLDDYRSKETSDFAYRIVIFQSVNDKDRFVTISLNTQDQRLVNSIKTYLARSLEIAAEDYFTVQKTSPLMEYYILKITVIALAIGIVCIFVYALFRLDWAQFIGILVSAVFSTLLTISIIFMAQVVVTYEMIAAFLSIIALALAIGTIIMSRAKQNKRTINMAEYETFFTYMREHQEQVKRIKHNANEIYKNNLKQLMNENPDYSKRKIKAEFKAQLATWKKEAKAQHKQDKESIRKIKHDFSDYNYEHNFLQKVANNTIKQLIGHYMRLSIILLIVVLSLITFLGSWYGFAVVIFVGIIVSMFMSIFVAMPLWVWLERYRALNKVRIKKYLDSQRVELDEQLVEGINT